MKYLVALLVVVFAGAPDRAPAATAASELRKALQQYHPAGPIRPRELTPAERAELRRQLSEFRQPARRKP